MLPLQSPLATQLVALLLLQVSTVDPLKDTLGGLAAMLTVGAVGEATVTLTESVVLPETDPLQVRTNALLLTRLAIVREPLVG